VLFSNVSHGHIFPLAIPDRYTEDSLCQEDSFGVVAQRSVPNFCHDGFRLVEPLVNAQIIVSDTAELAGAILGMFQRMSHELNLPRLIRVTDGFVPVVLHPNRERLKIERNRSEAALAVLISFWCESFEEIAEFADIQISRQTRFLEWTICRSLELRRFCAPFISVSIVADSYLGDACATKLIREFQYFHLPFLIFSHDEFSFLTGFGSDTQFRVAR
jgi:hypothetical protein